MHRAVSTAVAMGLCALPAIALAGSAVLNEHGISVKVITTRDCQLHEAPDSLSNSAPCAVFSYWYVLPPDKSAASRRMENLESLTRDGYYRVAAGDSERELMGWLHQDDVVEWHHRQALRFAKRAGRQLAHFFPSHEVAFETATSGAIDAATHREPQTTGGNLVLMPLLDTRSAAAGGAEFNVFEVAFMSGRPISPDQPPAGAPVGVPDTEIQLTQQLVREESTADIVFVLDTTGSMRAPIQQVLRSIGTVAERLIANEKLRERLRFGLVGYRDRGDAYLTEIFCTLEEGQDHQLFIARLGGIEVAGGGDHPEDVLAGLARAVGLDEMKWNPFAWKQIVLVGDSSVKGPDHPSSMYQRNDAGRTIAALKAEMQPGSGGAQELMNAGFVLTAVQVKNPDPTAENAVADSQWSVLVEGRSYHGDLITARGGLNPEDFADKLTASILTRVTNYEAAVLDGKGRTAVRPGGTEAEYPYPVLDLIEALPEGESETEGMRFTSRFCTEYDPQGNRLFVPHLFIRKGQLKSFNSMVEFIQGVLEDAGEPGSRDVGQILRGLQVVSTSLNLAEPITADMPLDRFLQVVLGLPLRTPVFQVSIGDLAAMSQTDYEDWVRAVRSSAEIIATLLENPNIWHKLHPTAGEREDHAFVALADLP